LIPATQREARLRTRIGRYVVTGRIGRGGMGTVYRACDEALEREVAVKVLTIEGALDTESRRRFEVEAKAAARLQHPNIVTVYELGEDRGIPFIAMELLAGSDLDSLLRSGEELALQEKIEILIQVCCGLAYAHERAIVHRDIKPSNIRLLDDGTAKILDFGIAKLGGTQLTKSGMMVGTVNYMSPEQIRGAPLTGRSDLFSVGVILYELFAGQRPFAGEASTEILYRIVHDPPAPLRASCGRSSPAIEELAGRLLEKDPERRPSSAEAVADALGEILKAHIEELQAPADSAAPLEVAEARGLLRGGLAREAVARLERIVQVHPASVDARRALRQARRALVPGSGETAFDAFPELEGTFQATPTQTTPETVVEREALSAPAAPPLGRHPRRELRWWLSLGILAAVAAPTLPWLLRGPRSHAPSVALSVASVPPGAEVLLDGQATGVVTDGRIEIPADRRTVALAFRKPGFRTETRTVALPLPPGDGVSATLMAQGGEVALVTEPPGARVSLDGAFLDGLTPLKLVLDPAADHRIAVTKEGHTDQEIRVPKGSAPAELRVALAPVGPPGAVAIASRYPLDVVWRGKTLARGERSPRVSLPAGRQTLTLVAPAVFMRSNVVVDVRAGGEASIATPDVGLLSIRANPDNCRVLIDGAFVDYPPILNRPVAVGSHSVVFDWPDGRRKEEIVRVGAGPVTYVMGRKD
jgi:predicted Ser/Thr protein kinase